MIKGIGIDIIELKRIKKSIEKSNRLVKRILTNREQATYENLTSVSRQVEFIAGRFAAKEAFAKATGTGIGKLGFQDIEVTSAKSGAPILHVQGFEGYTTFISITHSKEYAVAQVIIEE
ncbi:holo-ACP synthase [Virgibacillus necropolis]|uniref:Holo-[acyl-carrier-protein] synthase n=1 Tax=Virgibacillus necropolis TaxID=163877 RepID=A0A221MHI3_9BACI|nr:holo-ACP synthase [Virgibacillus necropolis]ASN07091.1 holo-ACP synthase [Virgibacillus necropolis]